MQQVNPAAAPAQPNPLEQLKDIQLPETIGLWPLAPGWWIVIALISIILIAAVVLAIKAWRARKVKRQALTELQQLPVAVSSAELNKLLKQACMGYYPRELIANQYGDQWLEFLTARLPQKYQTEFKQQYGEIYQAGLQAESQEFDKSTVQQWLQQALPPKKRDLKELANV